MIVLIYFGLPAVDVSPVRASSRPGCRWRLVLMAFSEEIFWAGITSVPKGQWEASRSTGLCFGQTLLHVVLPQALRLTIPPLTNRTIAITKGTALGTVVAVHRDPGPGLLRGVQLLQSLAADAGRGGLPRAVPAGRRRGRWIETRFAWKR